MAVSALARGPTPARGLAKPALAGGLSTAPRGRPGARSTGSPAVTGNTLIRSPCPKCHPGSHRTPRPRRPRAASARTAARRNIRRALVLRLRAARRVAGVAAGQRVARPRQRPTAKPARKRRMGPAAVGVGCARAGPVCAIPKRPRCLSLRSNALRAAGVRPIITPPLRALAASRRATVGTASISSTSL